MYSYFKKQIWDKTKVFIQMEQFLKNKFFNKIVSSTEYVKSLIQKLLYLESELTYTTVRTKEKQINLNWCQIFQRFLKMHLIFLTQYQNLSPPKKPWRLAK